MGRMENPRLDLAKEYGLVLEGGGAKGSYQIGAWKALREAGVSIRGIAGASVGALNGAMICMDDLERAEYIWENIRYSRVMDVDDEVAETVRRRDWRSVNVGTLAEEARRVLKDRGFDVSPLRRLIEESVDEGKIRGSGRELYITTYSVSDRQLLTIDAKKVPEGQIGDMLMASAYLPVFKREKLGGKTYLDGGGWNNVPVNVLLEEGYRDIIIVRIYGLGFDSEKAAQIPDEANIYHIAPRQSLGGLLQFDKKQAAKNMRLGYFDAQRLLRGLKGRWYYLDAPESEDYYFARLAGEMEFLKTLIPPEDWPGEDGAREGGYRFYMERAFPRLAKEWKMKEGWDYREFYLTLLENAARSRRIGRFRVYRPGELLEEIRKKQDNVP